MPFPLLPLAMLGGGAALGALASRSGKKEQLQPVQRYTPGQQSALDQLLAQGQQNANFAPIEERARAQFATKTVPSLAERFTALNSGAQNSSAFSGSLGQAGADLESQLAALRSQLGMRQLQLGLTPQFDTAFRPSEPGFLGGLLGGLGQGFAGMGALGLGHFLNMYGMPQQSDITQTASLLPLLQSLHAQNKSSVPPQAPLQNTYAQALSPAPYMPYNAQSALQQSLLRGLI